MEQAPRPAPTPRPPAEWRRERLPLDYPEAVAAMEARAAAIRESGAPDLIWQLEHPALYTAGTSAKEADLLRADFPVHATGRGGQYTYHGPGQRVVYCVMDLQPRGRDLRRYVFDLEQWIIDSLAPFGVEGLRREGRVGIWVDMARHGRAGESKIAAIGVRVRKWVAYHGLSLNVAPDLSHFGGIVPCGLSQFGVTSLRDLGIGATMEEVDAEMRRTYPHIFG